MSRADTDPREAALRALGSGTTALPRLVHHDPDGARIELSGRVLLNWTAKAADLLVSEFDVQPGDVVALDLPAGHWRAAYWALAAWAVGATLDVTPGADGDVRVGVAGAEGGPAPDVAVTLAALARRAEVDLPAGALDEAAVLATYADTPPDLAPVAPDDVALRSGDTEVTVAGLAAAPEDAPDPGSAAGGAAPRLLLTSGAAGADPAACLRLMIGAWAGAGDAQAPEGAIASGGAATAVVVAPPGADAARLARLAEQEGTGVGVDVSR